MGSKEDVAARIEADTKVKTEEMNQTVSMHKDSVSWYETYIEDVTIYFMFYATFLIFVPFIIQVVHTILELVYNIKPELHKNYRLEI